ncbi:MAG: hypothetical protein OER97_04020 [Gammaproteobacteria bacterium]|nr:hypothetical protein [Gammaproteobacteria bacterium]
MKTFTKLMISAVIVLGLSATAAIIRAQASPQLADFHIRVALNEQRNGVELECDNGCGWTSLKFSCGDSDSCHSWIDASGMTGE